MAFRGTRCHPKQKGDVWGRMWDRKCSEPQILLLSASLHSLLLSLQTGFPHFNIHGTDNECLSLDTMTLYWLNVPVSIPRSLLWARLGSDAPS